MKRRKFKNRLKAAKKNHAGKTITTREPAAATLSPTLTDKNKEIEEQRNRVMAILEQREKEIDAMKIGQDQRRAVLTEFVDCIETYFAETAFQFAEGLSGSSLDFSAGPELDDFLYRLHPSCKAFEARLQRALEMVEVGGDPLTQDLDRDLSSTIWWNRETGYKLGILVGARLAGYAPQKVRKMVEFLVGTLR